MSFSSGANFGSHSTVSQCARSAKAARVALLVWIGPLSNARTTDRATSPGAGPQAPVEFGQEGDDVRAALGPAGPDHEVAAGPVEHRHLGGLPRLSCDTRGA